MNDGSVTMAIGLSLALVAVYVLPPILDSVERKIKARIHSRIGPPILQTWYDIFKLFKKKTFLPHGMHHIVLLVVLYVVLTLGAAGLLVVVSAVNLPLALVLAVIMFITGQAIFIAIPFLSSNPFAIVGSSREIMLVLVNELFTVLAFGSILWSTQGLTAIGPHYYVALLILFIAAYVSCARPPFDLAEAEPELASGVIIELSGPILGMFHYSNLVKRFFVKMFVVLLLIAPAMGASLCTLAISIVGVFILWCIYATIAALLGRSRVDIAPTSLLKIYVPLTIIFFILLYIGG